MNSSLNVISGNDLRSGLNVYFFQDSSGGHWDMDISKADLFDDEGITAAFDLAKKDMANNIVVDCLVVSVDKNHIPTTVREVIRSTGPSSKYGHQA